MWEKKQMSKYNMKTHEKEKDQRSKNIAQTLETLKTQYGLKEFFIIYEKVFFVKDWKKFYFQNTKFIKKSANLRIF